MLVTPTSFENYWTAKPVAEGGRPLVTSVCWLGGSFSRPDRFGGVCDSPFWHQEVEPSSTPFARPVFP